MVFGFAGYVSAKGHLPFCFVCHDVLIAGQARARGLVLITRNTGKFAMLPGLLMEGWKAE